MLSLTSLMSTTHAVSPKGKNSWYLVDAKGQVLGRLATRLALILRGKHRASFTPHAPAGDCVVVVNADKIRLTGKKLTQKFMKRYTGYPGGLRLTPYSEIMAKKPEQAIRRAVWGMLPHNRTGRHQIRLLKVYRGETHPHAAQQPVRVSPTGRCVAKAEA